MKTQFAVLFGKAIFWLSRLLHFGGGSAAPGLYALNLDPNLVKKLSSSISTNIVITGTNGKTTTSRLLSHFAKTAGLQVIRNHTGSNMERGIASTLIQGNGDYDLGIWEMDEGAFNTVSSKLNPDVIVFLNVFRDQLDRYGEIDTVVSNWSESLKKVSLKTKVFINGDDASLDKLQKGFKGKVQKFGVKDYKIVGESLEHKKEKESLDFEAKNVRLRGLTGSSFKLSIVNCQLSIVLPLPGIYHIYDFLAAFAVGSTLGFDGKKMIKSLNSFSPAFGRVEKLDFGYIFLIKNPAGATQVFATITPELKKDDRILLALNDNLADGTDVSWIWDAEFERLQVTGNRLQIICSGTRADDLANRLKYAGFDPKHIAVESDLESALKKAKQGLKGKLFILPTYTALLKLQSILAESGIKNHYWKEED